MNKIDRKDFLKSALVLTGAGVALVQGVGCSSNDGTPVTGTGGKGSGGAGTGGAGTGGGTGGAGTGGASTGGAPGTGGAGTGGAGTGGSGTGGEGTGGSGSGGTSATGGAGGGSTGTGGATGGGSGANACMSKDPNEVIMTNHAMPHTFMLSVADTASTSDKTYSIKGASMHDHMITITGAMFAMLRNGMMISVTSTTGAGHTHVVTVSCA